MRNLERRLAALEKGNGYLGVGELLDSLDNVTIDWSKPGTWPAAWRGKVIDPKVLAALDGLEPQAMDRVDTSEVQRRVDEMNRAGLG
jgi:hypothetical protein